MDAERSKFLASMIDILTRLTDTSISRGEPLLASVLAIARGEAEDALRHAEELAQLDELRKKMSSANSWRPADVAPAHDFSSHGADAHDAADLPPARDDIAA